VDGARNGHRLGGLGRDADAKSYTNNMRINVDDNGCFSVELALRAVNLFHRIYFIGSNEIYFIRSISQDLFHADDNGNYSMILRHQT
jgi:hypothetical protein